MKGSYGELIEMLRTPEGWTEAYPASLRRVPPQFRTL